MLVNAHDEYALRVQAAKRHWEVKTSTQAKAAAFREVRATLAQMCVGVVRCAYCEDSAADEIEHILPKTIFPEQVFVWENYLFACGPCNAPKSNRYGVLVGAEVVEFIRYRGGGVAPPPPGMSGFVDPRREDPLRFFDLDLGGTTPEGENVDGTFDMLPAEGLSAEDSSRAIFTIEVLNLNREILRVARANAFGGFVARLREYVLYKQLQRPDDDLERLKSGILTTPHLTVFAEMRRQRQFIPVVNELFEQAEEALSWPLVPVP
jgi:uncharacterized protein (TIGR02646 family)